MHGLINQKWRKVLTDYHQPADQNRINVVAWRNLEQLPDMYFVRKPNAAVLVGYLREVGVKRVWHKIRSRRGERARNDKYVSCGFGTVSEIDQTSHFRLGQLVAFVAPCHPACVSGIVLPATLMRDVPCTVSRYFKSNEVLYWPPDSPPPEPECWWREVRGWTTESGRHLNAEHCSAIMDCVLDSLETTDWTRARRFPIPSEGSVAEVKIPVTTCVKSSSTKSAVLFGYGNYAKTQIIPNLGKHLSIRCIHEIDPTQIVTSSERSVQWDTCPTFRKNEHYDIVFIAGFHHSHASLAIAALKADSTVIVEKPLAVTSNQLEDVTNAVAASRGKYFAAFQRRYSPFNDLLREDLEVGPEDPISYHCIVYEVPLPTYHWYRWANSRSRLVSNGCHWIDHFLFLNNFTEPTALDLTVAPDSTINCSIALRNGAFFTMVLTEKGSSRIGVREYVELRHSDRSARILESSHYVAETATRVVRRKRINKESVYGRMYKMIGQALDNTESGDSVKSITISAGVTLELEQLLVNASSRPAGPVLERRWTTIGR